MPIIQNVLKFLDTQASAPKYFGIFHIVSIALMLAVTLALCILFKKGVIKNQKKIVLVASLVLVILGLYKQIVLSFSHTPELLFNYDWNNFPWHFLTVPVCIGLFIGMTDGKVNEHFISYFAIFGLLAGLWGMLNPNTFETTVGINVYSMLCYGSYIALSVFVFYSKLIKVRFSTFFKSLPVFAMVISIAISFNEIMNMLFPWQRISMFGISRHFTSDIPIYSLAHNAFFERGNGQISWLNYIVCILIYFALVSVAALIPFLGVMCVKKLATTDFDAEYGESSLKPVVKIQFADDIQTTNKNSKNQESKNSETLKEVEQKKNDMINYFYNLRHNFDYNAKGSCGYIAISMILSYYDTFLHDYIVPESYDVSSDNPRKSSPGTKRYEFEDVPSDRKYAKLLKKSIDDSLHSKLVEIGSELKYHDYSNFEEKLATSHKDTIKILEKYMHDVLHFDNSYYTLVEREMDYAKDIRNQSKKIRDFAILLVKMGFPVILSIAPSDFSQGHTVIAYDYNEKYDKLYCHMGWDETTTHTTPEDIDFPIYKSALALKFNFPHTHTDNYYYEINGKKYYYCYDSYNTKSTVLLVTMNDDKKTCSVVGVKGVCEDPIILVPTGFMGNKVTEIGASAFENCSNVKEIMISDTVETIHAYAFKNCANLKTLVIPASVKRISGYTLNGCQSLTTIKFKGTLRQWNKINKHETWDHNCGLYKVYCSDGIIRKIGTGEPTSIFK